MRKLISVYMLLMALVVMVSSVAEESSDSITTETSISLNLQDMSIEELLHLQSEVQRTLADKGYVHYEELERGSKGDSVSNVQERLKELGYYQGSITGKYDSETQKAFKAFEKNNSLPNDGKATQADLIVLFSSTAVAKASSATVEKQPTAASKKKEKEVPDGYLPFSDFDYTEYFRYPEKYYGTKIVLKGKVVQVLGSRKRGYQIRLATSGSSDIVYIRVNEDPGFNILENDRLTVCAVMKNTYTYTSTFLSSVTIPSADADSIILN